MKTVILLCKEPCCDSSSFQQVYKKLGQTHLALMNFSWAMDLDPKGANNQIKEAIDKRYLPEDEGTASSTSHSLPSVSPVSISPTSPMSLQWPRWRTVRTAAS